MLKHNFLTVPLSDCSFQIIDSIIEESQKSGVEDQLLRGEEACAATSEVERAGAEGCSVKENLVPEGALVPPEDPDVTPHESGCIKQLTDVRPKEVRSQDIQDRAPDVAGPAQAGQDQAIPPPPDITSALGQPSHPASLPCEDMADILEQVPMSDADGPGPSKPPRQFTVEPDIVASTKKQPPSRPPLPSGAPPPRPPPPSRPSFSAKKSQEVMRPAGLEGMILTSKNATLFMAVNNSCWYKMKCEILTN